MTAIFKPFRQALQGTGFPIIAELLFPAPVPAGEALRQGRLLAGSVNAIQVAESTDSGIQAAPLALASLLMRDGIDTVPRISCRNRNRIALQSDLLGMRALGVNSIILIQGSALPGEQSVAARAVLDVNCLDLVAMAQGINEEDWPDTAHEFLIGTGAKVFSPAPDWTADELLARANSGARFLQTQPCFSPDLLKKYMQSLVQARLTWNFSVIITLAPLPSTDMARWLIENGRDVLIPDTVIDRLDNATDPVQEGIEICAGLMRDFSELPGVSGFNLLTLGNPDAVIASVLASGLGPNT